MEDPQDESGISQSWLLEGVCCCFMHSAFVICDTRFSELVMLLHCLGLYMYGAIVLVMGGGVAAFALSLWN